MGKGACVWSLHQQKGEHACCQVASRVLLSRGCPWFECLIDWLGERGCVEAEEELDSRSVLLLWSCGKADSEILVGLVLVFFTGSQSGAGWLELRAK